MSQKAPNSSVKYCTYCTLRLSPFAQKECSVCLRHFIPKCVYCPLRAELKFLRKMSKEKKTRAHTFCSTVQRKVYLQKKRMQCYITFANCAFFVLPYEQLDQLGFCRFNCLMVLLVATNSMWYSISERLLYKKEIMNIN